jgi:hypothetical protein
METNQNTKCCTRSRSRSCASRASEATADGLQEVKVERLSGLLCLMHHAAATQPTSRRFVWLSGALPIPDPVPRSGGQNRRAGFWFLVPVCSWIGGHCQCHVLAPKQEVVRSQMQTNTANDQNVAFARSLHVISAIHAQLHTADCICCVA